MFINTLRRLVTYLRRFFKIFLCGIIDLKLLYASLKVLVHYVYFILIINRKIESQYRREKKEFIELCDIKLKFNQRDLFSNNVPSWLYIFDKFSLFDKKLKALEIGSYEGRSSFFLLNKLKRTELTCVDTFKPFHELKGDYPEKFNQIYENFKYNTQGFSERALVFKQDSRNFFLKNRDKFDLIYVDGSHAYKDVLDDAQESFANLNQYGIIIFDDFLWEHQKVTLSPTFAILKFLKKNLKKIKILYLNYQIIIQKIG
tara:strand:+ start:1240 stop:2013 length:774 start_codon:yes stop_codon:yes gene_type:complete